MTVRSRGPAKWTASDRAREVGGETHASSSPERTSRKPRYGNPTGLPDALFLAICERNHEDVAHWIENATAPEIQTVADTIKAAPWCALTYRLRLLKVLAKHACTVPTFVLRECAKDPDLMTVLAHNPRLSEEQLAFLGRRITDLLANDQWPLEPLARSLEGIIGNGFEFGLEHIERLMKAALDRNWWTGQCGRAVTRLAGTTPPMQRAVLMLSLIPQVSEEHLMDLVGGAMIPPDLLSAFLTLHPSTGPRVWLAALDSEQEVMEKEAGYVLSEAEGPATHPEVRERLASSPDPRVLRNLLLKFPLCDTPEVIRRFLRLDAEELAGTLADGPRELREKVPDDVILELLRHPSRKVRSLAFQALG